MQAPSLPKELVEEILSLEAPFDTEEDKETCSKLLDELSEEDQELAAQTSYTYWVASVSKDHEECLSPAVRKRMALKEVRRHYIGEDKDYDKTLVAVQASVQHRKTFRIDLLRACAYEEFSYENEEDAALAQEYREKIESDLAKQALVVRGRDTEDRPVVVVEGRTVSGTDADAFVLARVYLTERAMATAEILSRGRNEKIVAILDYEGYQSKYAPGFAAIKQAVVVLQGKYPERLKRMIVLEPPFWARTLYNIIYPFLSKDTRQKFVMVSGAKNRRNAVTELVSLDQITTNVLSDGGLELPNDVQRFFRQVPFHCLYDEFDDKSDS